MSNNELGWLSVAIYLGYSEVIARFRPDAHYNLMIGKVSTYGFSPVDPFLRELRNFETGSLIINIFIYQP